MSDEWSKQIPETDLEMNWNLTGNDLVVRWNKGGVLIARVFLRDAAKQMTTQQLMNFSPFSPDFAFRVGDMQEGLRRAMQTAELK
jgi:6-phosphogluconate dehydrogenase